MKIAYQHLVPSHSSREGGRIHGLVLHTTEGHDAPARLADLIQLGRIFDNEEASSHYGVNVDGKFARYVHDRDKAWTQCNFNPYMLSLEQIAFSAFSRSDWFRRHAQLRGAAEFLMYGHVHYGVPLRKGEVSGGGIIRDGVFQHKDLGLTGCGHSDCGDGYPEHYVILLARYYIAHRLHPRAPHTVKLRREVNRIRRHFGVKEIGR